MLNWDLSRLGSQWTFGAPGTHSARSDHLARELNQVGVDRLARIAVDGVLKRVEEATGDETSRRFLDDSRQGRGPRWVLDRSAGSPSRHGCSACFAAENVEPASDGRGSGAPDAGACVVHIRAPRPMLTLRRQLQDHRERTARPLAPAVRPSMRLRRRASRRAPHRPASRCSWGLSIPRSHAGSGLCGAIAKSRAAIRITFGLACKRCFVAQVSGDAPVDFLLP